MKVEQLNSQQIDWTKPQVVVDSNNNKKVLIVTNRTPTNENTFSGVDLKTGEFSICCYKDCFKPENATQYPIELKLTIETPEELCTLLHDLALNMYIVNSNTRLSLKHQANMSNYPLFDLLDDLAKERNLYKND